MKQLVDLEGAADYTGFSVESLKRRRKSGTFVSPTDTSDGTPWWSVEDLDKWLKTPAGKRGRKNPPLTERTNK